jgi:hypothetical protein
MRIRRSEKTFDQRFAVETNGIIKLSELDIQFAWKDEDTRLKYQATNPVLFQIIMRSLPIKTNEYVFVDIGSGKGRVLILASTYKFKKIIGIEFAHELHAVAEANVRRHMARLGRIGEVECILADAAQWQPPEEKLVIYLFNPFGADVMERVLANVERSLVERPRDLHLIYIHPIHGHLLLRSELLHRTRQSTALDYVVYSSRARTVEGTG